MAGFPSRNAMVGISVLGGRMPGASRADRSVQRERGAAILQHEAAFRHRDAGAEIEEQALDQRHRHAGAIDHAQMGGVAPRDAVGTLHSRRAARLHGEGAGKGGATIARSMCALSARQAARGHH